MFHLDATGIIVAWIVIVSLALVLITLLAYRRSEESRLLLVSVAFMLFFLKGILITLTLYANMFSLEYLLLYSSLLDLGILLLLFLPFFKS